MANETAIVPTEQELAQVRNVKKAAAVLQPYLQPLVDQLSSDRLLVPGTHSQQCTFAKLGNVVIRVEALVETSGVVFNWKENVVRHSPDKIRVNITPATLGDLLDCQRDLEKNGSGEARVTVEKWIGEMRQGPETPPPLQIQILNPEKIGKVDKVMSVKRDSEGRLSGAVLQTVD